MLLVSLSFFLSVQLCIKIIIPLFSIVGNFFTSLLLFVERQQQPRVRARSVNGFGGARAERSFFLSFFLCNYNNCLVLGNFFFTSLLLFVERQQQPIACEECERFWRRESRERERETKKSGGAFFRNAGGVLLFLGRGNSSRRRHGRVWEQCAFWEHNASCGC